MPGLDAVRFDAFARTLARRWPRRGAVFGLAGLAASPTASAGKRNDGACRFPGVPCRRSRDCCDGMVCEDRRCRCRRDLTQCGDFCREDPFDGNFDCCKPYKSPCSPGPGQVPCCSSLFSAESDCRGELDGNTVCCGLSIHPCTQANAAYCCSGVCGPGGRCEPESGEASRRRSRTAMPDRPGAAPRGRP